MLFVFFFFFQGYISTLCVAGKLYQGVPAATIVESTESVACVALSVNVST